MSLRRECGIAELDTAIEQLRSGSLTQAEVQRLAPKIVEGLRKAFDLSDAMDWKRVLNIANKRSRDQRNRLN